MKNFFTTSNIKPFAFNALGYSEMVSVELFRPEYWDWEIERTIQTGKETTEQAIRTYFA
nr:hypothetical protein [Paenibacillus periandrae]